MSATINATSSLSSSLVPNSSSSSPSSARPSPAAGDANTAGASGDASRFAPNLLHKVDGHVARINAVHVLPKEDAVWTISEDRGVRLWLKRDLGRFWPAVHLVMPAMPTALHFNDATSILLVGLLNGHVLEYVLADDWNSAEERHSWAAHSGVVMDLRYAPIQKIALSCSKDRSVMWHCHESGLRVGSYALDAGATTLEWDAPFVWVGDSAGAVHMLRIEPAPPGQPQIAHYVNKLERHAASITCLAWDGARQRLYSGGADKLIVCWDIGGRRGRAYELHGHAERLVALQIAAPNRLLSIDDCGRLVAWDTAAARVEPEKWKESQACQLCDAPFFWNIKSCWERKVVGARQHHCRLCGAAVCAACSAHELRYPTRGFELPARVCRTCYANVQQQPDSHDLTPLARSHELRAAVSAMQLQRTTGRLVTAGLDRHLLIWDATPMIE